MQELGQPPKELVGAGADLGPMGEGLLTGAQDQCVISYSSRTVLSPPSSVLLVDW